MMSDLISRQAVLDKFKSLCDACGEGEKYDGVMCRCCSLDDGICIVEDMPSAEPEMITIEELSNQLGCATIQSALYWFDFLKTLDLLGFAIIKKETK